MHNFKELGVWNKSIELCTDIYKVTEKFPQQEKYGLISQITRSCVSIASNLAEGAGRNGNKEFIQFIGFALASSFELETQLEKLLTEIQKMMVGLKKSLNR